MTRFIQYPFDKSKMTEVHTWVKSSEAIQNLRKIKGVKDMEISFCPGEGWLAARYIFDDLESLQNFPSAPEVQAARKIMQAHPYYDNTRDVHQFVGFYLEDV